MSINVGDIVHLRSGAAHIVVTRVTRWTFDGYYKKSGYDVEQRPLADAVRVSNQTPKPQLEIIMAQQQTRLYKTTDDRYGEFLAKDGGKLVLKMSDTSHFESFDPEQLSEVRPYTIQIQFNGGERDMHFEVTEGSFAVGNLVILGFNLGRVKAIDTKAQSYADGKQLELLPTSRPV